MYVRSNLRFITSLIVILLAGVLSCSDSAPEGEDSGEASAPVQRMPDQIMYGSDILFTEEGVKTVLIESEYLEKYEDADSTILTDITATFFDSLGAVESVLDADSGLVRQETDWLKVWGDVDVVSDKGVRLEADSLFWDQRRNMITTESFVRISREGSVQTGYGLESNSSLTEFQIKNRVRGRFENVEEIRQRKRPESDTLNPR